MTVEVYNEVDLSREIVANVSAEWEVERAPLLISKLGSTGLSDEARRFVRETRTSLKRFIQRHLAEDLRFVPMPRQGGGVVPANATQTMSDTDLESAFNSSSAEKSARTSRPSFYPEVWVAFRDPLPEGQHRVLTFVEGKPKLELKEADHPLRDGEHPIEGYDTAITSDPDRAPVAAQVRSAITNWSETQQIPIDALIQPTRSVGAQRREHTPAARALENVGFLAVLRAIPPQQLARLSIPGDIVLTVLERLNRR